MQPRPPPAASEEPCDADLQPPPLLLLEPPDDDGMDDEEMPTLINASSPDPLLVPFGWQLGPFSGHTAAGAAASGSDSEPAPDLEEMEGSGEDQRLQQDAEASPGSFWWRREQQQFTAAGDDMRHLYTPFLRPRLVLRTSSSRERRQVGRAATAAGRAAAPAALSAGPTGPGSDAALVASATAAIRHAWQRAASIAAVMATSDNALQQEQLQQHMQLPARSLLCAQDCRPPVPCSFLQPGMAFRGCQKLLQRGSLRGEDQWSVRVVLQDVDISRGHVAGSMQAFDVAGAEGPIDTYFEGNIVDDVHHTFWTRAWGASCETDLRHWSKFEGFGVLKSLVVQHAGRSGQLEHHPFIFMRWKEQFFVSNMAECGLTIAGFYYVALDRRTGHLRGFYYDPNSSPYQELDMQVDRDCHAGSNSSRDGGKDSIRAAAYGCSGTGSSSTGSNCSSKGGGVSFATYSFA